MARDGDTQDMLPERGVRYPPAVHHAHRRPLGFGPAPVLAGAAAFLLLLAVALFATGAWIVGIVCLGLFALTAALFVVAVRHEPDTSTARLAIKAADRTRSRVGLALVTVRAWSSAAFELVRIKQRRRRLRVRLRRQLAPLGEAVHRDDPARAEELKAEAAALEQALQQADQEAATVLEGVRRQIERELVTCERTEALSVQGSES